MVLGLLLGCAMDNSKSFNSLSKEEKNKIRQTRDARINLFPGDKNLVYIGSFGKRFDKAVFPGSQGGPLEHVIAAKAVAFGEALKPGFTAYCKQLVKKIKKKLDKDSIKTLDNKIKIRGPETFDEKHKIVAKKVLKSSFGVNILSKISRAQNL